MTTKFVLLAALFAASVVFATATTYTTVVTTTVSDESQGQGSQQSCQQEIMQIEPNQCMQYFTQGQGQGRSLRSPADPMLGQEEQQYLQLCCNWIDRVSPQCCYEAIGYSLGQMQQQQQPGMGQHLMEKAEKLPQLCKFRHPTQCSFSAVFL